MNILEDEYYIKVLKPGSKVTQAQLDQLKQNWLSDPCYDLEEVAGFSKFKKELKEFRLIHEEQWAKQQAQKIFEKSKQLGTLDNVKLAEHLLNLEATISNLEAKVDSLETSLRSNIEDLERETRSIRRTFREI